LGQIGQRVLAGIGTVEVQLVDHDGAALLVKRQSRATNPDQQQLDRQ
jgi:hypothetical protein